MKSEKEQQPKFIGKLRAKIVALSIGIVAVALLVTFAAICYLDYRQSISDVEHELSLSIDRAIDDASNEKMPYPEMPEAKGVGRMPEIGSGEHRDVNPSTPIAIYRIATGGKQESVSVSATAVIDEDNLETAIHEALESSGDMGSIDSLGLIFCKQESETGIYVAFADESAADSWKRLALALSIVWVVALVVLFVIVMAFSKIALRPAAEAWRQQRRFIADASHELKTPLTVILANMAIIRSRPKSTIEDEMQWIEGTDNEARKMQGLVQEMLELMRPEKEAGKDLGTIQRIDFSDIVEGEMLQFESVAFEKGASIDGNIEEGAIVKGDAPQLHKLCAILLDNACKYSSGNGEGEVRVRLARSQKSVTLSITNNGGGIPEEDLPHVFERFYRVDRARARIGDAGSASGVGCPSTETSKAEQGTRRDTGGFGLGLAIAKKIALDHHGTLEASSSQYNTTFTFTLSAATKP